MYCIWIRLLCAFVECFGKADFDDLGLRNLLGLLVFLLIVV